MSELQIKREFQNAALSVMFGGQFNFTEDDIKIESEEVLEITQEVADESFGESDSVKHNFQKSDDVNKFYRRWQHVIWQLLCEQAREDGETPLRHLAINFTQADNVTDADGLELLLCDFGITMAAREIIAAQ